MKLVKVFFLVLVFVFSTAAQERKMQTQKKGLELRTDARSTHIDKIIQAEVSRIVMLSVCPVVKYYDDESHYVSNNIDLNEIEELRFDYDYTANYNTRVRFHLFCTGPRYAEYKTSWEWASYGIHGGGSIDIPDYYWKEGIYKIVVIAETQTLSSGAQSTVECVVRLSY